MIRRTTPHTITQNQVLSEESFTGKKGIDVTQAPVVRDTVEDILNMDIDLDGAMIIRKPIKSLGMLSNLTGAILYTKDIFDNNYFYITENNGAQYLLTTSSLPIYLKDKNYTYAVTNSTDITDYYIDLSNAKIINMNTSSLITNVKIDLVHFMGGAYYDYSLGFTEVITSLKLYKGKSGIADCYYLEYIDPYIATIEASETLSFNPNTAGYYTYALTDTYDSQVVKVNGILAYTTGNADTVKGLTETNANGHYIISSVTNNYSNPILLKAFCNFIKDTPNTKYYCAWEYSYDGVTWETLPEFSTKWQNNSEYTTIKVQNLASINYELSTELNTVYNYINRNVISLNVVTNKNQALSARPDVITINNIDKAVYRFVIYRQYHYYAVYTSKDINTLFNKDFRYFYNTSYNFIRYVDANDDDSHDFKVIYDIPIGMSNENISCKLYYKSSNDVGASSTSISVPITVTTIATNVNKKTVRITNTNALTISAPTSQDYVGMFGKFNFTLVFYYVNNALFDTINYQIIYTNNSYIINNTPSVKKATYEYDTSRSPRYTAENRIMTLDIYVDTNSELRLVSNTFGSVQRGYLDFEYALSDKTDYMHNISTTGTFNLQITPYFPGDSIKNFLDSVRAFYQGSYAVQDVNTVIVRVKNSQETILSTYTLQDLQDDTALQNFFDHCINQDPRFYESKNATTHYVSSRPSSHQGCLDPFLISLQISDTINYTQYLSLNSTYMQWCSHYALSKTDLKNALINNTYYNTYIDANYSNITDTDNIEIATDIANFNYTMVRTTDTSILNTDFINSNLGKKLYYKYRLYSYGDNSFKNNIYVSNSDSLITPLFNAIDLPITDDSIITALEPWREYLIAASEQGVFLITPTGDDFTSKILSTFIGIPKKDGDTLKSILNGAIFKSGSKVYILQPSIYASSDSTINIVDISKPISKYIVDTEYDNFAFTTEQYYFLCIPNTTETTVLKYEFATKRWTKHKYPDRFIRVHMISLDDIRIIGEDDVYQIEKDITEYTEYQNLSGYGDIINGAIVPIHYEINTGAKSYSMQYPHQFVESKILFSVSDNMNVQLPLEVDIYSDNFKNILHVDPSTSNTLWRDIVAPKDITNAVGNEQVLTLNSDIIEDNPVYPIMKQLFLRYSGKGFTVTHHLQGNSNCKFKCYVIYVRFKETILKK